MSPEASTGGWLAAHRLVGVLRAASAEVALEQARAALAAGLGTIEITFTVPNASSVIESLVASHPHVAVGAGTLLGSQDLRDAVVAGASFLVSPHLDEALVSTALDLGVPYLPGVATPSEVMRARSLGCRAVKLFPIDLLGGPAYVRALLGPIPDLEILATGGIAIRDIDAYYAAGARSVGLGSIFRPTPDATRLAVRSMLTTT